MAVEEVLRQNKRAEALYTTLQSLDGLVAYSLSYEGCLQILTKLRKAR